MGRANPILSQQAVSPPDHPSDMAGKARKQTGGQVTSVTNSQPRSGVDRKNPSRFLPFFVTFARFRGPTISCTARGPRGHSAVPTNCTASISFQPGTVARFRVIFTLTTR